MDRKMKIGIWRETESRRVYRTPGYYAADWEILETHPGHYDVYLLFSNGYTVPMPQSLHITIAAQRVDGRVYSGFGGLNHSSQALPPMFKPLIMRPYSYTLADYVRQGKILLYDRFTELAEGESREHIAWVKEHLEFVTANLEMV